MITDMLRETLLERLVREQLGVDEVDGSSRYVWRLGTEVE